MQPLYITLLLFSLSALACSSIENCICTDEFVTIRVTVVDKNNSPVTGLITKVRDVTGKIYNVSEYRYPEPGVYNIMTDGYVRSFTTLPKEIIFSGKSDSLEVTGNFLVNTSECKCHVNKVNGPDTLVAVKR